MIAPHPDDDLVNDLTLELARRSVALQILKTEGQSCINEYISGKLVTLKAWSDRMAVAITKANKAVRDGSL